MRLIGGALLLDEFYEGVCHLRDSKPCTTQLLAATCTVRGFTRASWRTRALSPPAARGIGGQGKQLSGRLR